eukprot:COSAG02_NODE_56_length_43700_cov_33.650765_15_plen_201_part_00
MMDPYSHARCSFDNLCSGRWIAGLTRVKTTQMYYIILEKKQRFEVIRWVHCIDQCVLRTILPTRFQPSLGRGACGSARAHTIDWGEKADFYCPCAILLTGVRMEPLSVYLTVDDRVDVVHCHKGWTLEQVRCLVLLVTAFGLGALPCAAGHCVWAGSAALCCWSLRLGWGRCLVLLVTVFGLGALPCAAGHCVWAGGAES